MDVHVTRRRVLAIIVDSILLAVPFWVMSILLGSSSAQGGQLNATLNGLPFVFYLLIAFATLP